MAKHSHPANLGLDSFACLPAHAHGSDGSVEKVKWVRVWLPVRQVGIHTSVLNHPRPEGVPQLPEVFFYQKRNGLL